MHINHNVLLSSLTDWCYTITSRVVRFITLPHFECVFVPSPPFRVCRWALTSFSSAPLSPHFLLSALLSHHLLGSAFSNPTSFSSASLSPRFLLSVPLSPHFLFQVRLWALTFFFSAPLSPHLLGSPFSNPTSFRVRLWASPSFFWVGHSLQCDHSSCFFYLGRSPITMRLFLHLGRSPMTIRSLFLFPIFLVGHPLQWDHSFTWVGHPL